jgi:hypothetical protein
MRRLQALLKNHRLLTTLFLCLNIITVQVFAEETGKLVIIIDDIGYNLPLGKRASELPGPITYAVLPHTPVAKKLAFYAASNHPRKEIIVHMPMEAMQPKALGEGGLLYEQNHSEFMRILGNALDSIPHAKGLSNHMGSRLTALPDRMEWLMQALDEQGMYFVDSKTTRNSAAKIAAGNSRVPYLARDYFLDHDPSAKAISDTFKKAQQAAKKQGMAIVVAHPYKETLNFLEQTLPDIESQGLQMINVSEALQLLDAQNKLALKKSP